MFTKTALAGLVAVSMATASEASSKRGSIKFPLTRRNAKTDDQTLTNIYTSTDWTTVVSFGGQNFSLQVDTGSSDIWVLSTDMSKDEQQKFPSNHFFDPSKSSTFKMVDGAKFNISYSSGEIYGAGKVGTDNVGIGSDSINMPFGVATECSPVGMVDTMYDGMLGLAFGAGNTQQPKKGPTWMEAMQSQLDKPVFTFNLPLTGSGQMIEFGHIDHTLYNGTLMTAAINNGTKDSPNGWIANVAFSVGGKNISSTMNELLMDTGGLEATIPDADAVKAYWGNVKGAKDSAGDGSGWLFPCNAPSLPDLTYNFLSGDGRLVSAAVPGKFMNSTTASSDPSLCVGAFQSTGGSSQGTIGYGFFHSFFTVFDQSVPSISFAPYPDQELLGKAMDPVSSSASNSASSASTGSAAGSATGSATGSASGTASAAGSSAASNQGTKPTASGYPSGTGTAAAASGSTKATGAAPGGAVAATAAPSGQSDSAPGGNTVSAGHSGASGLTVPLFAMGLVAAVAGLVAF